MKNSDEPDATLLIASSLFQLFSFFPLSFFLLLFFKPGIFVSYCSPYVHAERSQGFRIGEYSFKCTTRVKLRALIETSFQLLLLSSPLFPFLALQRIFPTRLISFIVCFFVCANKFIKSIRDFINVRRDLRGTLDVNLCFPSDTYF